VRKKPMAHVRIFFKDMAHLLGLARCAVVELASIGPGPLCAMLLADLGADVVRMDRTEPSGLGVAWPWRRSSTSMHATAVGGAGPEVARRPDAVLRLMTRADVLIEGFRPGVAESWAWARRTATPQPGLVYGRMTGFGQTGPLAAAAGHDLNYIALTGALHAIGPAGGKPVPPLNLVGDYGGGALYLAFGVLAALFERQRSGRARWWTRPWSTARPRWRPSSTACRPCGTWGEPRAANLLDGGAPFYDTYETADGRGSAWRPLEPKFFAATGQGAGPGCALRAAPVRPPPVARDARGHRRAVRQHTRDEWCARLEGSDACFAPRC
jgi:alpha-methylacyl-CoA racemase